jgi:mannose-1-phosphate guanylyltransferase
VALQREETPLGTGGALSLAQLTLALGDEPVMVHNGDIWIGETDILALITAHAAAPAHATLLVIDSSGLAASERKVGVDEHGWVTDVDGVGSPHRAAYRAGFSGIFVASGAFGTRRPGLTMACNKEHGFWPALRAGQPMRAVRAVSYWSDIGSPLQYLATHQALLALRQSPAVGDAPARQSWIHPEARVHPSAQLGPYAVIGAGATVGANARVCHAVVWDGVDVAAEATLEHAIAWWGGVLRP